MSGLDDLAGRQNGGLNILEAAEHLAALLDLPSVNVEIRGARIFGQGSRSPVEIDLSNGETMEIDTLRDMVRPQNLIAEVAACAGATPTLKQPQAVRAVALVRALAEHRAAMSDNDHARAWGLEYLQSTDTLDVDLNDQAAGGRRSRTSSARRAAWCCATSTTPGSCAPAGSGRGFAPSRTTPSPRGNSSNA